MQIIPVAVMTRDGKMLKIYNTGGNLMIAPTFKPLINFDEIEQEDGLLIIEKVANELLKCGANQEFVDYFYRSATSGDFKHLVEMVEHFCDVY